MTTYSRPAKHVYQTASDGILPTWVRVSGFNQSQRFVTRPLGIEPTPYDATAYRFIYAAGPQAGLINFHAETAVSQVTQQATFSWSALDTQVKNKTYTVFRDKIKSHSLELGNYASPEGRQAVDMIVKRAKTLYDFVSALKRGNLTRASYLLGHRPPATRKPRQRRKRAASLFLEYRFGWAPLIKDIYDAVDYLQHSYTDGWKSVTAFSSARQSGVAGTKGYGTYYYETDYSLGISQSAQYRISDPNRFRANTLGLINPASVIWENVPFSFVVDWFLPVSDFLNSYSDFVGIEFRNPSYSRRIKVYRIDCSTRYGAVVPEKFAIVTRSEGLRLTRYVGLIQPTIYPKVFKGISVVRGATAIALLVNSLKTL